jgi:3'-5' exoribonuclease
VLTHHGDRRPATPEALALYRLNAVDAAVKGALEHGVPSGP